MTNRPDLITQLSKLNPTKRQWVYDGIRLIRCFRKNLFITHDAKKDDIHLTLLAPTMRIEILAMAKEIEELKAQLPNETKRELKQISLETEIDGKTFVPILELCYMALKDVYGDDVEKDCSTFVEVFNNNDQDKNFGVVTFYFDIRIGFSLTIEEGHTEFELSANSDMLHINQLKLFNKLSLWGFKLPSS